MRRKLTVIFSLSMILTAVTMIPASPPADGARIQLAILLDTSGSMEGLIEQAKTKLWRIVNELAQARKGGRLPRLEVALYEYGKSSIPASEGFLRLIVPLTTDLDRISEELFELRTNGGSEYCGQVILSSLRELDWSQSSEDYKVIFIAGNEPFSQGRVDYRTACEEAVAGDVIVNTIFCGNYQEGVRTNWQHGAEIARGKYLHIDHNQEIAHIIAPQDEKIILLGRELNETYIAYGPAGDKMKARQKKQDGNAEAASPSVAAERSIAKASAQYRNASWDMVDAEAEGKLKVAELDRKNLPEKLQAMTTDEIEAYIKKTASERERIRKRIAELQKEREQYVKQKRTELRNEPSLDTAVIEAVRDQAVKKKFRFKK